jgi:hypothetical protein
MFSLKHVVASKECCRSIDGLQQHKVGDSDIISAFSKWHLSSGEIVFELQDLEVQPLHYKILGAAEAIKQNY